MVPLLPILLFGCAVHTHGVVETDPLRLQTQEGRTYRLVLGPESKPVGYLDGYIVEIDGTRGLGALRVMDWTVQNGPHGMAAWVGKLEAKGVQIGLQDRNSDAFYFVSKDVEPELEPFIGQPVLLEGYVEGPHVIRVMFYDVLTREGVDGGGD